jgi:hypothetical protein
VARRGIPYRSEHCHNARLGQADEFGERRIPPARAARQRRDKRRHSRAVVPVERPQVDIARGTAIIGEQTPLTDEQAEDVIAKYLATERILSKGLA